MPNPDPTPFTPLWVATHEGGDLMEWQTNAAPHEQGGLFPSGDASGTVSTDYARSGARSAKLTIDTSQRESGARLIRWHEGRSHNALYYAVWVYIPEIVTPNVYLNIFQFKSRNADNTKNDPFIVINIANRAGGAMFLRCRRNVAGVGHTQNIMDLPAGQWVHLEAYLREGADNDGRFVFWQDGVELFDLENITTRYPGGPIEANHWGVNSYSDGTTPAAYSIYVDDAVIATSRITPNHPALAGPSAPEPTVNPFAEWTTINLEATAVSPFPTGEPRAELRATGSGVTTHRLRRAWSAAGGATYRFSLLLQAGTIRTVVIDLLDGAGNYLNYCYIEVAPGYIDAPGYATSITEVAAGVYRAQVDVPNPVGSSAVQTVIYLRGASGTNFAANGESLFAGAPILIER